ncbi:hypothetical protein SS50377_20375 [Spironucleus salmonicida]|uniref:Uncharacterized protein n=1 Tax=Spironucleus salmonicida TaxID=348837 RepID=V6LQM1_9EUKA|nr:hypothetical protein SS50377_20375 [Spironucleus salmonicida]|eukprot:EST43054.1 Hypothetical protein SS50377_17357 [Spironucleus salmonicida]
MGCGSSQTQDLTKSENNTNAEGLNPKESEAPQGRSAPPPAQTNGISINIGEKTNTQQTAKLTTEHMMIPSLTLSMHGGQAMTVGQDFLTDAQVMICAPSKNVIKFTATGDGKIILVAFAPRVFPLTSITEVIEQAEGEGEVTLEVTSTSINGFIVAVGSEGREISLAIDGQGKPILSLLHVEPLP